MTQTNNIAAKLAVAFVAVAMAFALVAPAANAQSTSSMSLEQLIALVNQLQAQLAGTGSASGSCSYTFTRSLGQGSTGVDVMNLQKFLNSDTDLVVSLSGAGSPGSETSYYGPATAAAVSKFQTKYSASVLVPVGLTSPTGYFGPSSMAKANALCATGSTGGSTGGNTGGLQGGAGSLTDVKLMAEISNEDVGEGTDDSEVYGVELEAENSDVALTAVTIVLAKGSASSNRFDRYADDVSVWLDGVEVARVDADEFTSSNSYTKTITLKTGAIIRDGDVGELVIAVSGVSNLDSAYADQTWTAKFSSVRYVDAQGATITDSAVNSLSVRTMTFKDFATASELKVKVASGSSSINTSRTVEISSTSKTSNIAVLSFKVTVEGSSDINIDEMQVTATSSIGLSSLLSAAYLYMDGSKIQSTTTFPSSTSDNQIISFSGLDRDLDAGKSYDFEVRVDVSSQAAARTIGMDVTTTNRNAWTIEDEKGDTVAAADLSGSASADDHSLVLTGANLALGTVSVKEVYNSNNVAASYGEYRMEVKVTSIGETIYVLETAASSSAVLTTAGASYIFEDSSGTQAVTASSTTASFTRKSGGTVDGSSIRINEGETVTFEFVGTFDPTSAGQYRARIVGIGFGSTNAGTGSSQSATPTSDFRSSLQTVSN